MNYQLLFATLFAIFVLWFMTSKQSECYRHGYANLGSLTQDYVATHPNKRVSDFFAHCAPGEDCEN